MCGRYTVNTEEEIIEIREILRDISVRISQGELRNEACPGTDAPIITVSGEMIKARWGLDKWDGKGIVFNARSESLVTSRFFSPLLQNGRCIVPAHSYFEWDKSSGKPVKYEFTLSSGKPIFMAGLSGAHTDGTPRYTVITRQANENIFFIHNRMPLIFDADNALRWISSGYSPSLLSLDSLPVEYRKIG